MRRFEPLNVLLVEDNPGDARLITDSLSSPWFGTYEVKQVDRLSAALEYLASDKADIVLLDLSLPDASGFEAFRSTFSRFPNLPVIILTGMIDEEAAIGALHDGAQDYLIKGQIDEALLCRAIHYAVERKRSEMALKKSEELFRSIFNNAPIGIYRTTPEGEILMANPQLAAMMGFDSVDQLLKLKVDDHFPASDIDRKHFRKLISQEGKIVGMEYIWTRKDGSLLHVRENANAIRDDNGKVVYFEGTVEDLTQIQVAELERNLLAKINGELLSEMDIEDALERISASLASLIPHVALALGIMDRDAKKVYYFCSRCGSAKPVASEQDLGTRLSEPLMESLAHQIIYERRVHSCEISEGDKNPLHDRLHSLGASCYTAIPISHSGIPLGVLFIARLSDQDMDERKIKFLQQVATSMALWLKQQQIIDRLTAAEYRLRKIIDESSDAMYILQKSRFVLTNKKFRELFEYSAEELKDCDFNFMRLVAPKSRSLIEWRAEQLNAGAALPACYEFSGISKSGRIMDFEVEVTRINYEGSPATQGILQNITQRNEFDKTLRNIQTRMIEQAQLVSLGKYSWGIAQRLAKPLSVILRHMQELASSHHTPELRESFEAANRMGEFLEELQRKANHDQDFSIGNVNINRVLEEQLAFAELDLETDEEMEIEVSLADDLPLIRGVISDFSQALGNILANAWEALYDQPRKKIHIRTSLEADGSISIAIEDSGRGIDPRILPSIFEPFFTTKPKAEDRKANEPLGTGLGLAIVRLVLEKYEAKCEVKSELGSGTTFLINIPAKYTIIPDGETERDEPVQEKAAVAV